MELLTHGGEHHERRKVDDDDGDGFPSLEPRADSRSALPRGFRAWRRLRIIKRDETFSLIFFLHETEYMELELRSEEPQGAHEVGARPGGRRAPPSWLGCGPPDIDLLPVFFIFSKKCLLGFSGHSKNFCFLHIKQHHGSSAENSVSPG